MSTLVSSPPGAASDKAAIERIAGEYPVELRAEQVLDAARIAWHMDIVRRYVPPGGTVIDLGGGIGLMSVAAAAMGFRSILVDDFLDDVNTRHTPESMGVHRKYGVDVRSGDALKLAPFAQNSLDAVMSFESIEHWHHSPRAVLQSLCAATKPGGLFLLGVPNCVDLRKRLTIPFGYGSWSPITEWYDKPVFRGHVRELDIRDLRHIARDLNLEECRVVGRNWQAHANRRAAVRAVAPVLDHILRLDPTLCSDLYLIAKVRK